MAARAEGVMVISRGEALGAELALAGVRAAVEVLRAGRYPKPTPEQFERIARIITRDALAAGILIVETGANYSDDELDAAAEVTAHQAVREVCGPPPQVN